MANPTDHLTTVRAALDLMLRVWPGPLDVRGFVDDTGNDAAAVIDVATGETIATCDNEDRDDHATPVEDARAIVALRNSAPAIAALADECERLRLESRTWFRAEAERQAARADAAEAELSEAKTIAAPRVATVGELLATAPVGSIVEFVDCAFWYQARVNVDDSVEWYETRRRHATDARWMPWRRGIPPVRPSARLVPAAEADADPNQRGPLLAATAPVCPGPDCPMCNGEACDKCNPGPGRPRCDHDGQERHEPPTATPRCSCTHEAGDSRCNVHPTCSECGASTTRPVDGCEACRGPLPKGG